MQDLSKLGRGPLIAKTSTAMTPEEFELKKSYNQFMKQTQQQNPFMSKGSLGIESAKFQGAQERERVQRQKASDAAFRQAYEGKPYINWGLQK